MKYDVTIVGAGPAGSTAANYISEKGFKVALIDKSKFPRDKPCGGGLPQHVLKRFKSLISEDMIESHSYGGTTYSASLKYEIKYKGDEPFTTMVLRKKFDFDLVKKAIDKGTDFIDDKKVKDIKIFSDKASALLADDTKIDSDIIIGADGIWSTVAKKVGLRKKTIPRGLSVVEEYELDEKIMDEYFSELRLGYIHPKFQNLVGYGWVFPKKQHLNIGIVEFMYDLKKHNKASNLKKYYENYFSLLKKQKLIPDNLKIGELKGGALPIFPLEKTYCDRVILVGDAGGFIDSFSGEGIYYAMTSGQIAAETVEKALSDGNTSSKMLSNYQKSWKKDFGKDLKLMYWISKIQRTRSTSEKNFKLINQDEKLKKLLIGAMTGNINLNKYKWKILKRYLYCLIKDKISKP
jgi:geranylgeranyl reductase family protein